MASELMVNTVRSYSIGIPGRSLNTARSNHFVIDEPPYAGGPGEAIGPAEAFLSGISACGVLLVQSQAERSGFPLQRVEATIEGIRNRADTTRFQSVNIRFDLSGVNQEQAEELVGFYQGH